MRKRALISYLRYHADSRGRIAAGVGLALLRAALLIPVPLLVGRAIDTAIPDANRGLLLAIGAAIVALTTAGSGLTILARAVIALPIKRGVATLRRKALETMFSVSRKFYSSQEAGSLHDRIVHETARVEEMAAALLEHFLPGTILIVGLSIVLATMNLGLMLITIASVPGVILLSRGIGRWARKRIVAYHRGFRTFSQGILHVLRAMDLIRIQSVEEEETETQNATIDDLAVISARRAVGVTVYTTVQQTLLALTGAVVLVVGGFAVINASMTLGELISFYAGFALMRGPLGGMSAQAPLVIEGLQSLTKVTQLLEVDERRPYTGRRSVPSVSSIELDGVRFSYGDVEVLHDIDLKLPPRAVTGIVGPNGSGKSTIANLMLGFYRPDGGEVRVDGIPYDDVSISEMRRRIGVVPQRPLMVSGSIRHNITYGRDHSDDEVWAALRLSEGEGFVRALPDGLESDVGADGVRLSGGEQQRIVIARALVHQPDLLLLDEPTNHLDADSLSAVVANIRAMDPRPTIVLISHRPEVVAGSDQIIRIKQGNIVGAR